MNVSENRFWRNVTFTDCLLSSAGFIYLYYTNGIIISLIMVN